MTVVNYDIELIAEIVRGKLVSDKVSKSSILQLSTDSRKIIPSEDTLFFAIKGNRNDGHHFIKELYERGICNFIVSEFKEEYKNLDANFIQVDDTLTAMQELAAHHRNLFSIPVVGITGSNGKTVIKEWLYQLLHYDKQIVRSPKSYNSQIGVPLSVWQMSHEHDFALFEAGISLPNEMEKLQKIIQPTIGIFTNIGQAHTENFTNQQQKTLEKLKLFSSVKLLIYCKDYLVINEEISAAKFLSADLKLFTWSRKSRADLQIGRITKNTHETKIQGIYNNDFIEITIPFTDEASIENAIHCWALMLYLEYENEIIAERMLLLSPVAMRLELKEGINNCSIINDSYNSDLGSLTIALDFLNQQKQHNKRTLLLSDILQSGKNEENLYKEVAELIAKKNVNCMIGIGESICKQSEQFQVAEKSFYNSTEDFIKNFTPNQFKDETILLKGARVYGFERISNMLQQKAHETVFEINLNAIIHNLNYYRSRLKPETKIMAMVKAFSYGSGSFEIANVLQFHRVNYLAVAYADEGVELRKAGITLPIMVMNPEEQCLETMLDYSLEPEIYSFQLLNFFIDAVRKRLESGNARNEEAEKFFPVHLKMDTGMNRLGFEEDALNELIIRIKNSKHLKIKSVFSHLAGSDEKQHDNFTQQQIDKFKKFSDKLRSHFDYPILRHILNSSGIIRFSEAQFDMVRLGIGLYGIAPTEHEQNQLQHVSTLKTTISQIKNVAAHETIGYSRKGLANRNMQIATVGIGYADGLNRRLSNGVGKMLVNGEFAPIIGNICMDMCMLDITDIPAQEGDDVIVFGNEYPITQLAKDMGTIPYEVLTTISQRVKRIYFQE